MSKKLITDWPKFLLWLIIVLVLLFGVAKGCEQGAREFVELLDQ
jgi:hypothetical protein